MNEKMKISEYKGFELWDTPAPEGWRVHQYPVQVTCNGEHVNCFADAHEAMSVIDGMDADTIAYHMRRAPATEPTAAAQGEGESWGVNPTERELVAYGDGYASGLMDGPEYAPLKNEIIALQAALQQAQRERDAALATLKPFAVFGTEFIRIRVNGDDPMHSDRVTHALNDVEITVGDWQAAASAQQAAQPADGEG